MTETNREVNLSEGRLSHKCNLRLELSLGRDRIVEALKEIASRRQALVDQIDIKELWEALNTEQEWIDLDTMTEFCFPNSPTFDHESAVVRAFFQSRLYFKFSHNRFFPNPEEVVAQKAEQEREAARRDRIIQTGSDWLKNQMKDNPQVAGPDQDEIINLLKSFYIFEKEIPHYEMCNAMLTRAGIDSVDGLFRLLVKVGALDEDINLDLPRYAIPTTFSPEIIAGTNALLVSKPLSFAEDRRQDLTALPAMTIDGQATLDFDDAISIEDFGDRYRLGIHIVDVGQFIGKGDAIDQEALCRGSSIYMPDLKIPMLPSKLAEDLCSLKAGELRPAISVMVSLTHSFEISGYEIFPSLIRVKDQLTYYDVNLAAEENKDIIILRKIAEIFRQKRLTDGAVQITLPEISVWINGSGEVVVNRINRESPGRMLVSEIMIMANWLMAKFLTEHQTPAVFRSQIGPKERLFKGNEGTLFQNWMQRKLLNRFILNIESENHAGLGLNAYVTATSPIRKYFDLATQRQIRSVFGLEKPYTQEEMSHIIQVLEQPMSQVSKVQSNRNRYWLLKALEKKVGRKEEAIVLFKRKNNYKVLLTEYMLECDLPLSSGVNLKPEDLIQVTIQRVSARKDVISIFMS